MNYARKKSLFSCPNQIRIIHIVSITIIFVSGCFTEAQGLTQQAKVAKSPL